MSISRFTACPLDPKCQYAQGHPGDCTTVEVGKHVLSLRKRQRNSAYSYRLKAILEWVYAEWLDALIEDSTEGESSPLLIVGWVSQTGRGSIYGSKLAGTWHRDRHCKRNRAMGYLVPRLYLETSVSLRPCSGCGKLSPEQITQANADVRHLRDLKVAATEGICWGQYGSGSCGQDSEPGKLACAEHAKTLTLACHEQHHNACDNVLETRSRADGSIYTSKCNCWVCNHPHPS